MKPFLCIFALLFLTIAAPTVVSADTITYNAPLNGASEQSPLDMSPGVGFAIVTINTLAQTIEVNVTFSGLTSGNTSTLIHCCTATPGTGNVGVASTTPNFPGFTSGTTSGTPPSMRNAEELSMTTVPLCTAGGAKRREVALPAENSAMSAPASACSVRTCTGNESPR